MKKTLFLFLLVNTSINNSEIYYRQKIKEFTTPLFIKYFQFIDTISKIELIKKVTDYFHKEKDKSQDSDFILTISIKDKNVYKIKLLNIYNLRVLKDKYLSYEESEFDNEDYEFLKNNYPKLKATKTDNKYLITINNEQVPFKTNDELIDLFFIKNEQYIEILEKIYEFDHASKA